MLKRAVGNAMTGVARKISSEAKRKIAPLQEAALSERCILVDDADRPIGEATKEDCHKISSTGDLLLHRAFSVFMFNASGELLLQKRSANKITFPNHVTNSCCSHPLAEIPGEVVEDEALGVKRAAQRRLNYELGLPRAQAEIADFTYLTRILYEAKGNDDTWGEHEVDYILFLRRSSFDLNPNADEISECTWVARNDIGDYVRSLDAPLTPWFHMILDSKLPIWWDNLDSIDKFQDHEKIHRLP